jgi:hypothetical protein
VAQEVTTTKEPAITTASLSKPSKVTHPTQQETVSLKSIFKQFVMLEPNLRTDISMGPRGFKQISVLKLGSG